MANNAKINLIGNLVRDPVMRQVGTNNVCSMRIAVTTSKKKPDNLYITNFYDASVWGKPGEYLMQHLQKGSMVWVSGEFYQGEYTGQDGRVVQTLNIENADVVGLMRLKDNKTPSAQTSADNEIPF